MRFVTRFRYNADLKINRTIKTGAGLEGWCRCRCRYRIAAYETYASAAAVASQYQGAVVVAGYLCFKKVRCRYRCSFKVPVPM